jgi:hypothetical protein
LRTRWMAIIALLTLSGLAPIHAATAPKVEQTGTFDEAGVPDALKKVLEPKGYRITLEDGSEWCKIWLRDGVPASGKSDVEGALFPQLAESTLIGVISFSKTGATDFRGQGLKPGVYAMRYELLPNDGNHLGVANSRDFVLLVRVADDPDPNAAFKFNDLVELSRKATGTRHPGPINLVQPQSDAAPAVTKDDQAHSIFVGKLKMQSGDPLLIGIVVKGKAAE